jgi:hypothetical protein
MERVASGRSSVERHGAFVTPGAGSRQALRMRAGCETADAISATAGATARA